MSTITFMIGNGFDLACGLKTKFSDTYNGYIKQTNNNTEAVKKFKKTIEDDVETWADFEMRMAIYAQSFQTEAEFVSCIRDYRNYLNTYLLSEQNTFLSVLNSNKELLASLAEEIVRSLEQLSVGLTRNDMRAVDAIIDAGRRNYQFLSFNYTNILDVLLETVKSHYHEKGLSLIVNIGQVIHVHGILNEDITLGVDNELQLKDLPYKLGYRGKRDFIKPSFVKSYDSARQDRAKEAIRNSSVICLFGLSLGDSDLSWRKELAEWLLEDDNHQLIAYCRSLAEKRYAATAITERMDDEEDHKLVLAERLFGVIEDKFLDIINNQIHIPTGTTIFNFDAAKYFAMIQSLEKKELAATT